MKQALLILIFACSIPIYSQCANTQGPFNPGSYGQNTSVGAFGWADVDEVLISDNDRAFCGVLIGILGSANTHYITTGDHGFSVPATANICGIQVDIEQAAGGIIIGSNIRDNSVRIIKNGVITGSQHAIPDTWFGFDSYVSYGGNNDLWGTTWTPADINAGDFGVAVSAHLSAGLVAVLLTAAIDNVHIQVFYDNPLPVELLYFTAKQNDNKVQFEWATSSEINCDYFTIEESFDAMHWEEIIRKEGHGNSNILQTYTHEMVELNTTTHYYRLCQYDHDGTRNELETVSLKVDPGSMKVFYKSENQELLVNCNEYEGSCFVEVFDLHGNLLKSATREANVGNISIPMELTAGNIYIVRISTETTTRQHKIMIN